MVIASNLWVGSCHTLTMNEQPEETELLLALLSSMIADSSLSHEILLGALADAGGDVEEAAKALNGTQQPGGSKPQFKRKRKHGLDGWITNKKRPGITSPARELVAPRDSRLGESSVSGYTAKTPICVDSGSEGDDDTTNNGRLVSPSKTKVSDETHARVSLMTILKQAPTRTKIAPKVLPRTLATPTLVAQYTPCTLHASILPPELACRLFYVMLGQATSWSRNKWYVHTRSYAYPS